MTYKPPEPPKPPATRCIRDADNSKPLTKAQWVGGISLVVFILLMIPPVAKAYLWWFSIWS